MKNYFRQISFLLSLVALIGLFLTQTHYHHESLMCVNHANEPHYVQNDNICPICTVAFDDFTTATFRLVDTLEFSDTLDPYQEIFLTPDFQQLKADRAPPASV